MVACDHQGAPGWCPALNFKDACIPHHHVPQEVALASMLHSLGPVQSSLDPKTQLGVHRTS